MTVHWKQKLHNFVPKFGLLILFIYCIIVVWIFVLTNFDDFNILSVHGKVTEAAPWVQMIAASESFPHPSHTCHSGQAHIKLSLKLEQIISFSTLQKAFMFHQQRVSAQWQTDWSNRADSSEHCAYYLQNTYNINTHLCFIISHPIFPSCMSIKNTITYNVTSWKRILRYS